jgi:hypothetical protein
MSQCSCRPWLASVAAAAKGVSDCPCMWYHIQMHRCTCVSYIHNHTLTNLLKFEWSVSCRCNLQSATNCQLRTRMHQQGELRDTRGTQAAQCQTLAADDTQALRHDNPFQHQSNDITWQYRYTVRMAATQQWCSTAGTPQGAPLTTLSLLDKERLQTRQTTSTLPALSCARQS